MIHDNEIELFIKNTLLKSTVALTLVTIICTVSLVYDVKITRADSYYWFQRSGSIAVLLSACVEFWLSGISNAVKPSISSYMSDNRWTQKYGMWYGIVKYITLFFLIVGTLVWGYGDLPFKHL